MTSMEDLNMLRREYEEKLLTDPLFSARAKLARNVLRELEELKMLEPSCDRGFAAFLVVAALEKALPQNALAEAWDKGMAAAKLQAAGIRSNVRNPYLKEEDS